MKQPGDDRWPSLEEPEPTLIAPAPPAPAMPPAPPPDHRIGAGMVLALAALALAAAGAVLAYLVTHQDGSATPTTVVVTTNPATATTSAPSTTVSQPRTAKGVETPNLVGQSLEQARAKLERLGLHVVTTSVASTRPPGTVVDQAPKEGAKLRKGWDVVLSVARPTRTTHGATSTTATTASTSTTAPTTTVAPAPTSATMPDVSQQTEQAAVTALNRAGLLASLVFVPSDDPLGTVEQQAKRPGTTLPYHAHVQVNVSTGPGQKPQLQVPNVVGRTLHDAVDALNGAQLRLIYVKFPVTGGRLGVVVQQSPLAGGRAPKNAQVLVFLAVKR